MGNIMLSGRGNIVYTGWIYGTPKLRMLRASLCLIWTPAKMNVWPAIRDMMVMLRAPGHVSGCHSVIVNTPETCASCQSHEKANTQTRMGILDICYDQRSERILRSLTSPSEGRRHIRDYLRSVSTSLSSLVGVCRLLSTHHSIQWLNLKWNQHFGILFYLLCVHICVALLQ